VGFSLDRTATYPDAAIPARYKTRLPQLSQEKGDEDAFTQLSCQVDGSLPRPFFTRKTASRSAICRRRRPRTYEAAIKTLAVQIRFFRKGK